MCLVARKKKLYDTYSGQISFIFLWTVVIKGLIIDETVEPICSRERKNGYALFLNRKNAQSR